MASPFHGKQSASQSMQDYFRARMDHPDLSVFSTPHAKVEAVTLEWQLKRSKADLVIDSPWADNQTICGPNIDLSAEELAKLHGWKKVD